MSNHFTSRVPFLTPSLWVLLEVKECTLLRDLVILQAQAKIFCVGFQNVVVKCIYAKVNLRMPILTSLKLSKTTMSQEVLEELRV